MLTQFNNQTLYCIVSNIEPFRYKENLPGTHCIQGVIQGLFASLFIRADDRT